MSKPWMYWFAFVAICFLAAVIGSWFTADSVKTWYPTLAKPAGTPPSWVFGPVWSILYFLMGTATWLVYRHRYHAKVTVALTLFCEALGLKGVNWHWLRHAKASLLDSVGTPLATTQALLGHSSAKITSEIYLHSVPTDARNAVVKVEDLIENAKPESEKASEIIGPNRTQVWKEAELASTLIQ